MIFHHLFIAITLIALVNAQNPTKPRALEFSKITGESITASWKLPKDSGDSKIVGFRVARKTTIDGAWKKSGWFAKLSYTFENLDPETSYDFAVQARNENGRFSTWKVGRESTGQSGSITKPSQPTDLELLSAFSGTLNIFWGLPLDDGGIYISTCRVRYRMKWVFSDTPYEYSDFMGIFSYSITGLSPDTAYDVGVQCQNAAGLKGAWASAVFTTVPEQVV